MYGVNPGKVELEKMVQDGCFGCHVGPEGLRGGDATHFVIRRLVCRMMRLPGRKGFEVGHRRATKPLDDSIICLAIPEALEDFWYFFISGQSLEYLFSHMVLGPKLLDLLDKLFLRMLNVNFVDAI